MDSATATTGNCMGHNFVCRGTARLETNEKQYQYLLGHLSSGRIAAGEATLSYLTLLADFCQFHHTGRFADGAIENRALTLGQQLSHPASRGGLVGIPAASGRTARRVLHVATRVARVGGHTRAVRNWVCTDADNTHSLVVTDQDGGELPSWLTDAVANSGGSTLALSPRQPSLSRAADLRVWAQQTADVVVLHTHPQDIIPILAFAASDAPPVVMVNHSDHLFWVGTTVSDAVALLRPQGRDVTEHRRNARCVLDLPTPLVDRVDRPSRADARRHLGIPDGQTVLVSVGRVRKYRPVTGGNFFGLVVDLLEANPRAHLYLIGVNQAEAIEFLGGRAPDRLTCVGQIDDPSWYQAAADLYLDGTPFGSQTAMLEAALAGVPTVPGCAPPTDLLGAYDSALEGLVPVARSRPEYLDLVARLIGDAERREWLGSEIRRRVIEAHVGDGWRSHLHAVYRTLASCGHRPSPIPVTQSLATSIDLNLCEWLAETNARTLAMGSADGHVREMLFESAFKLREMREYRGAASLLWRAVRSCGPDSRSVIAMAKLVPHYLMARSTFLGL